MPPPEASWPRVPSTDAEIDRVAHAFIEGALTPDALTYEVHHAVALWHLGRSGAEGAVEPFLDANRRFFERHGFPRYYDEAFLRDWLGALARRMAEAPSRTLPERIAEAARLRGIRTDAEIEELVRRFETVTLPLLAWGHPEHLTVAAWYLSRHPREEASRRVREGIRRFNEGSGILVGYHETLTLAWIALVASFLGRQPQQRPLSALLPALFAELGDKTRLRAHYRRETLMSDAARSGWVPPDLQPLE